MPGLRAKHSTAKMPLRRMDQAVPIGTQIVILQPGAATMYAKEWTRIPTCGADHQQASGARHQGNPAGQSERLCVPGEHARLTASTILQRATPPSPPVCCRACSRRRRRNRHLAARKLLDPFRDGPDRRCRGTWHRLGLLERGREAAFQRLMSPLRITSVFIGRRKSIRPTEALRFLRCGPNPVLSDQGQEPSEWSAPPASSEPAYRP